MAGIDKMYLTNEERLTLMRWLKKNNAILPSKYRHGRGVFWTAVGWLDRDKGVCEMSCGKHFDNFGIDYCIVCEIESPSKQLAEAQTELETE